MKECSKCNEIKSVSEFSKDKYKKDGIASSCKVCKKTYDTKYVAENKDKKYAVNKLYNEAHREEKRQYDAARRAELRDVINAKKRAYYHSEEGKRINRQWHLDNWGKVVTSKKNTKHKRRESIGTSSLSGASLYEWTTLQVKVCKYCDVECENSFHIDHVIPLSKGGLHELSNLVIACPSCNCSKGNKNIEEWNVAKEHNIVNPSMLGY